MQQEFPMLDSPRKVISSARLQPILIHIVHIFIKRLSLLQSCFWKEQARQSIIGHTWIVGWFVCISPLKKALSHRVHCRALIELCVSCNNTLTKRAYMSFPSHIDPKKVENVRANARPSSSSPRPSTGRSSPPRSSSSRPQVFIRGFTLSCLTRNLLQGSSTGRSSSDRSSASPRPSAPTSRPDQWPRGTAPSGCDEVTKDIYRLRDEEDYYRQ